MKKIIIILTLLLFTSSCKWFTEAGLSSVAFTRIVVPAGTPNFQKGYKEGCGTVLYSRSNMLYRTLYDYKFDFDLIDDPEYYFGRKRGYSSCFGYITGGSGIFSGGWDKYIYAQGTAFNMGTGNINDTVIGGNVFNSFGSIPADGAGGSLNVLTSNRANGGGVFGGHAFYGKTAAQQKQFLGW